MPAVDEIDRLGPHVPVMPEEVAEVLRLRPGRRYVDATVGEGGHAYRMLVDSSPDGQLLALDWDDQAIEKSRRRLETFGERVRFARASFGELRHVLCDVGWSEGADGILVDLGLSTLQLGRRERGFSFSADGPLDMRMDRRRSARAADLVRDLDERDLADIIFRFGEEPASRRIARAIVTERRIRPIETTAQLRDVIVRAGIRTRPGRDPATRTFQALRIAVNSELEEIEHLLDHGWELMREGGRLAILSYHSLEDRMVKHAFKRWASSCICPPGVPMCNCGWHARVRLVRSRRLPPSEAEVAANPRARSAGLRAVERLADEVGS
jgi:16S rRNA (cytosine1402-N4)-methyltransferase